MVVYTPNTPRATETPAYSQPLMLANFQYLIPAAGTGTGLQRDHNMLLNSATAGDGVHRQVTMTLNKASPGFAGGVSVLYPQLDTKAPTQSQLWFDNGNNVQLTGSRPADGDILAIPTVAANGCTFLPGGLLLQWGVSANNTVTFPIAFSAPAYSVSAIPTSFIAGPPAVIGAPTTTQFVVQQNNGSAFAVRWMAIGQA